jgi:hypothetical protein
MSTRTNEQLFNAIRLGSAAFHGPSVMPAWWQSLTEQQLWDLVAYVRTLHQKQPAGNPSRGAVAVERFSTMPAWGGARTTGDLSSRRVCPSILKTAMTLPSLPA